MPHTVVYMHAASINGSYVATHWYIIAPILLAVHFYFIFRACPLNAIYCFVLEKCDNKSTKECWPDLDICILF